MYSHTQYTPHTLPHSIHFHILYTPTPLQGYTPTHPTLPRILHSHTSYTHIVIPHPYSNPTPHILPHSIHIPYTPLHSHTQYTTHTLSHSIHSHFLYTPTHPALPHLIHPYSNQGGPRSLADVKQGRINRKPKAEAATTTSQCLGCAQVGSDVTDC